MNLRIQVGLRPHPIFDLGAGSTMKPSSPYSAQKFGRLPQDNRAGRPHKFKIKAKPTTRRKFKSHVKTRTGLACCAHFDAQAARVS